MLIPTSSIGPDTYMTYDKYGNQLSSSSYDPEATKRQEFYSETTYTEDGNFDKTSTDNAGNVTSYEYNTLTGINHNGFSYNYTYDNFGNVLTAAIAGNVICTNEYAPYNGGLVRSVYPDGTYTGTTYDEYGKVTSNSLNGVTMTKYVYDNDGNVAKKTDAIGGITTKYDYNDSGLLVRSEVYNGDSTASEDFESRMQYTYTKSGEVGNLSYQEKDGEVRTYVYTYDKDNKPVKSVLPDGSYTTWSFDSLRRNNKAIYVPKDGASDGKKLYTILEYKDVTLTTADGTEKDATTGMVSTYTNKFGNSGDPVSQFSYTYDEWGNITEIQGQTEIMTLSDIDPGTVKVAFGTTATQSASTSEELTSTEAIVEGTVDTESYERISASTDYAHRGERIYSYNEFSEIIKATETYSNGAKYIYDYVYDNGGNILTETVSVKGAKSGTVSIGIPSSESESVTTETHTYVYDEVWKDKLVSYDGKAITYDEFGCPIDYMGSAMTWDIYGGLTSVDNGTDTITYTYMGDGQRRSKTVNGVTTTYHYNNGMLLSETTGDETLRYYYDSTGKVASVIYQKGDGEETGYFYTRNVQGDIIAIYRSSDSTLVGTYEYDLWGKVISIAKAGSDADPEGILEKNPFRYRGYYYDNETGFYNLNARYYDPEIRRFISADSMSVLMIATVSLDCKNLFAYSENNPITSKDSTGNVVETVFDLISLGSSIVEVIAQPNNPWNWICMIGDIADLIPCVSGVGETLKGIKASVKGLSKAKKASNAMEASGEVAEAASKIGSNSSNYTYRALNQKDYECYTNGLGLEAKNPGGEWGLEDHLINGSGKTSWTNDPYISTTSDINVARGFNQAGSGYGIVKIDMSKVTSPSYKGYEIFPRVNGVEGLPYHYSVWQQEISVYQSIPYEAIVGYFH